MLSDSLPRVSRLVSIITLLQSKRMITARELANKFDVSIRTIYRDIKALDQAGIPVAIEEGKGYSLAQGFQLPPISFTEEEANALVTVEQFVLRNKDSSLIESYGSAVDKIKAVLSFRGKDKVEFLSQRVVFRQNKTLEVTSRFLNLAQVALTNFQLVKARYQSVDDVVTERILEPFALYSTQENWLLVAFCRLRKDFRSFRLDRFLEFVLLNDFFEPHPITLKEYFESCSSLF